MAVIYGQESGQQFWIDIWSAERVGDVPPAGARGVLCAEHGETLVPPRGWTLVDRRDPVPRLFKPRLVAALADPSSPTNRPVTSEAPDETGNVRRRAGRSAALRRRVSDVPRPQLFGEMDRESEPPGEEPEPSGSLLRDAFRRAAGTKRDATRELLRPTSAPPAAEGDQR